MSIENFTTLEDKILDSQLKLMNLVFEADGDAKKFNQGINPILKNIVNFQEILKKSIPTLKEAEIASLQRIYENVRSLIRDIFVNGSENKINKEKRN